jgi:hypothetical protein
MSFRFASKQLQLQLQLKLQLQLQMPLQLQIQLNHYTITFTIASQRSIKSPINSNTSKHQQLTTTCKTSILGLG